MAVASSRPVKAAATGPGVVSRPAKDTAAQAATQLSSGVTNYRKEVAVLAQKLEALLGRRLSDHPAVVKLYQYFFQALLQFAEHTLRSGYEATLELHTFIEQFLKLSSSDLDERRLATLHKQAKGLAIKLRRVANDQIRVQLLVTQLVGLASETEDDLRKEAKSKQQDQEQLENEARKRQQRASSAKTGAEIGVAVGGVAAAAGAVGAVVLPPLALVAPVGAAVAALYSAYQQSQATKQKRKAAEKRHAADAAADAEERAIEAINSLRGLVPCIGAFRDAIDSAVTGLNLVAAETERFMLCSRPERAQDLGDFEDVHEELSRIAEGVQGQCKGLEDELPKLQAACRALYDAAASTFPAVIPARRQILHTTSFPDAHQQQHQQHAPVPHYSRQNTYPAAAAPPPALGPPPPHWASQQYPHHQHTHGQQPHMYHYQHPPPLQLHPATSGFLPPVAAATEFLSPPGHRMPNPYPFPSPWH